MVVILRRARKPVRWPHHHFPGVTVNSIARRCRKARRCWSAILPLRKKTRDRMVALRKLRYAFSDRFHHPSTVGQGDAAIFRFDLPGCNQVIVKIQRIRMKAYKNLARPWRSGTVHPCQFQLVKSARFVKSHDLHLKSSNHTNWHKITTITAPQLSNEGRQFRSVAVGTTIADRPPHRTVRAAFPHTAPTLDE